MNRRMALGLVGAAASVSALTATPALADDTMRLAAPALDATALMFYANDQNYFKNAGLAVDLQAMANGEAVTLAIAGGAVDIGCSEAVSLILAFHKGIPLTLIAAGGVQTPTSATGLLFARNDLTPKPAPISTARRSRSSASTASRNTARRIGSTRTAVIRKR